MRNWINLIEDYALTTFYHVTEREYIRDIVSNGFIGGWGDVGFGVYLFGNIDEAHAYANKGGWDGHLQHPVILKIVAQDVDKVEPHPDWNAADYQNMWWHDMEGEDEDARWKPISIEVLN